MNLLTEADLAGRLQVTPEQVREWRRQYHWPCTKFGRTIRFTEQQVERIIRAHEVDPTMPMNYRGVLPGQTRLSAARNR